MAFTAKAVTAATASWPLVVGKRSYVARPVSAALLLRILPALRVPETADAALTELLRAAFGPRRWFRDPVAVVKRLPVGLLARALDRMLSVPGHEIDESLDPEAALIAAHRKLAHPVTSTQGPTLALAALTCEARLGAGWYFAPDRWPTSDGYAPMAVVWTTYGGLMALDAGAQLAAANAARLAASTDKGVDRAFKALQKAAYPPDPTMRGAA
jgi:hypothetical protein